MPCHQVWSCTDRCLLPIFMCCLKPDGSDRVISMVERYDSVELLLVIRQDNRQRTLPHP